MNLQSDNKQTTPSALSKLKQTTAQAMQTVAETPYQPIVYAIPKEDMKALLEFMRATTAFQPEMYEKFGDLEARVLTQDQWEMMWKRIEKWSSNLSENVKASASSIIPKVQDLLRENKECISQDGKRASNFSRS